MASEGSDPMNPPDQLITPTASSTKRIARKQDAKICCSICNKSTCLAKYRRHLLGHVKSGELLADSINPILFECRRTRSDIKEHNVGNNRIGFLCKFYNESTNEVCNKVVQDLKRHLVFVHKLDSCCSIFEEMIKDPSTIKRHVGVKSVSLSEADASYGNRQMIRKLSHSKFQQCSVAELSTDHIYDFETESISSSEDDRPCEEILACSSVDLPRAIPSIGVSSDEPIAPHSQCLIQNLDLLNQFNCFLLTKGGGGRRSRPVAGDLSSFRCLLRGLGWNNFWDVSKINEYITGGSKGSLSPSTLYGRLRVYERFVEFLRIEHSELLPSQDRIQKIEIILKNLKEALGKDRYLRNVQTMAGSRERIHRSFSVLREWRSNRANVEVKKMFSVISNNTELFSEPVFLKLRDYLIVEIILPNAQRSGIITGLLIKEVLDARYNRNTENNHYIYVQNHKTGYKQPAIIYLEGEIYNYLLVFVLELLPLLPSIGLVRCATNCPVFQTWRSGSLVSTNICNCLRSGLLSYCINDPDGRPTDYRKAAATLISMHSPTLQEPLSQFMCHNRSTAERHCRHHMSHQYLSRVFTELARCQALPIENENIITESINCVADIDGVADLAIIDPQSLAIDVIPSVVSDCDAHEIENETDLSICTISGNSASTTTARVATCVNTPSLLILEGANPNCPADIPALDLVAARNSAENIPFPTSSVMEIDHEEVLSGTQCNKYLVIRNGKSIFKDQFEEDVFFATFETLIENSLSYQKVTSNEVARLAIESKHFNPIWKRLNSEFGSKQAMKKVVDKIRTFARNNRHKLGQT